MNILLRSSREKGGNPGGRGGTQRPEQDERERQRSAIRRRGLNRRGTSLFSRKKKTKLFKYESKVGFGNENEAKGISN